MKGIIKDPYANGMSEVVMRPVPEDGVEKCPKMAEEGPDVG